MNATPIGDHAGGADEYSPARRPVSGKPPLRVAILCGSLVVGGTTTYAMWLAQHLAPLNVDMEVFSFTHGHPLARSFEEAGVVVHRQDERLHIFEDRLQRMYGELRRFRPDIVLANMRSESYEMLRYLPAGVLKAGIMHDFTMQPGTLLKNYGPFMDEVVLGMGQMEAILKPQFPELSFTYIRYGVPLVPKGFLPGADPAQPLKLVYFGRLDAEVKRVQMFPQIARELHRLNVPFIWTILGDGDAKPMLAREFEKDIKEGRVRLLPWARMDKLWQTLQEHDVYVLTSKAEGGPLSLIDAMSAGLVSVCSDIPCLVADLIHEGNGFRVPVDDPVGFANAIAKLHRDRSLLASMSRSAHETITEDYSARAMASRFANFFQQHLPASPAVWQETIVPKPILLDSSWKYSAPARWIRRSLKRIKSSGKHSSDGVPPPGI